MTENKAHRGEIIKQLIKSSGKTIYKTAEELGIGRTTIYRWIGDPDLDIHRMNVIANHLGRSEYTLSAMDNITVNFKSHEMSHDEITQKYITLLESYNQLLATHHLTVNELNKLKNGTRTAPDDDESE